MLGTNGVDLLVEPPSSTLEFPAVTFGNSVRGDQQLRDIQELIAKLEDVNRQLALPRTARPVVELPVVELPVAERPLVELDAAVLKASQPAPASAVPSGD